MVLGFKIKNRLLPDDCLRAMCCSDTQGWLGFPWPPKRGWAKTCSYAALAVKRLVAASLFFRLRGEAKSKGAGVKAAEGGTTGARLERRRSARSLALTQERPQITLRGLQGGRTAAIRRRPGQRSRACPPPTPPRPWEAFHWLRCPQHRARPVKDHSTYNPLRLAGVWGRRAPRGSTRPRQPRQARACAFSHAGVVPATDVRTPAGPHTTTDRPRPSSGAPGRWQAPVWARPAPGRRPGSHRRSPCRGVWPHITRCTDVHLVTPAHATRPKGASQAGARRVTGARYERREPPSSRRARARWRPADARAPRRVAARAIPATRAPPGTRACWRQPQAVGPLPRCAHASPTYIRTYSPALARVG